MKKMIGSLPLLALLTVGCSHDLTAWLTYAQFGIDADCQFGSGALAADVCVFGGETIALAKAAAAKDPDHAAAVVKQILISAETRKPELAPYLDWLKDRL